MPSALIETPPETELHTALKKHNPRAAARDLRTVARLMAKIAQVISDLSTQQREQLAREDDALRNSLMELAWHGPKSEGQNDTRKVVTSTGPGLGEILSKEEGEARLAKYAQRRSVESWAGKVAGAGEITKLYGIPRSTLSAWRAAGAVVGLRRGQRKFHYPVEQFVDDAPVAGIAAVLAIIPDARSAWLWLRQEHGALDGATPLSVLKQGRTDVVAKTAGRDFG